jgi:radical SAM protein with 4Fe4S-binding SPASM domain
LNIKKWQLSQEQCFSETEEKKQLDTVVWNCFVDEILSKAKLRVKIKKLYDFALFEKMEKKFGKDFIKCNAITNCGCCTSKMYIYPDLSVRACTCMDSFLLGNLKGNSYSEILAYMKEKKALLKVKENSPCAKCEWLYLCNGGCAGYSKYYFSEIGYGDKRCPKVKSFYGL